MPDSAQERKTETSVSTTLAIVQDRLRHESVHFKLGADFLDLHRLLFHRCYAHKENARFGFCPN